MYVESKELLKPNLNVSVIHEYFLPFYFAHLLNLINK